MGTVGNGSTRDHGPFVGREAELEHLRAGWGRALEGERQVAFLSGEPGIGKTRLALEFAREVERTGASTLYGRCDADPVVPFEPFVQVLQRLSQESPAGSASVSAQAMLVDLVPALFGGRSRERPVPPDSPTRRLMLFEGVRSVLRDAASGGPLLVVLDDLQWADADTVRLIRYLARGSWGTPALLLGIFRDTELNAPEEPLRAAIADLCSDGVLEQIELRGLNQADVRQLAEADLDGALGAEAAERITEASGGNPFFVRELAALIGHGNAVQGLPLASREVIARRLARLTAACRQVLSRASVLGTTADLALLIELWDGDQIHLAAGLGEAVGTGLLIEDEPRYRFTHALVQQALYQGLPLPERQQLHLRAARAIETRRAPSAGGRSNAIATHYRRAGSEARPDEALPHALAAGDAAAAEFALEEAIEWWTWALELAESADTDPRAMARLLERMASVLDDAREQSRAVQYLRRALFLHEQTGDAIAIAIARSRLGLALENGNLRGTDLTTARAHFEAALPVLAEASHRGGLASLHQSWGTLGVSSFRLEDLRHVEVACQLSAARGGHPLDTRNRITLGALAFHLGGLDAGLLIWEEVWEFAHAHNNPIDSGNAALLIAITAQRLCDPGPAIHWLQREVEGWPAPGAAAPWGLTPRLVSALAEGGEIAAMRARAREHTDRDDERIEVMVERSAFAFVDGTWDGLVWTEAETCALRAAGRGDRCSCQNLGHWLVRAYRARGEPERAVEHLQQELASTIEGGSLAQELVARSELAVLFAETGQEAEARVHLCRGREIFDSPGDRRALEGKLVLAEALLMAASEGPDAAAVLFNEAVEVFRRYANPWLEARAYEDWAGVLDKAHRRGKALAKLRQAELIYRRIGAGQPWLDRLSTLIGTNGRNHNGAANRARLPNGLTPREAEVLRLVAAGRTSYEIGNELVLSVRTVERHISNIYLKTDTHGRASATAYALAHGLA